MEPATKLYEEGKQTLSVGVSGCTRDDRRGTVGHGGRRFLLSVRGLSCARYDGFLLPREGEFPAVMSVVGKSNCKWECYFGGIRSNLFGGDK